MCNPVAVNPAAAGLARGAAEREDFGGGEGGAGFLVTCFNYLFEVIKEPSPGSNVLRGLN